MVAALQSERVPALRDHLLRLPSRRPQKGRQAVRDVLGDEHWAGADGDFLRAVAWTPGVFTWMRDRAHLVELPALWARVPLRSRDADDLAEELRTTLLELKCPSPHLIVEGDGSLVALWAIEPFRRPRKSAPDEHHHAFRKGLEDWTKAALKLSFAFEELGAVPLDAATAHEHMHAFVPFPLAPASPLRLAVADTQHDPPRLLDSRPVDVPLHVADISRPLARFDARMFQTLGIERPRGKTRYLSSPRTLEALETTAAGERHRAARTIACACVWDGLDYDATITTLRGWAARCVQDGTFPFRRRRGDELELLAQWAHQKLKVGGPDKVSTPRVSTRTKLPLVAQTIVGFLAAAGRTWTGSKVELAKQAALWALERGQPCQCPRTTVKRALRSLSAAGELIHEVARHGATWMSTWLLPAGPLSDPEDPTPARSGKPRVQSPQSTWAPAPAPAKLDQPERGAGGRLPPAGGGPGGAEIPFSDQDLVDDVLVDLEAQQAPKPETRPRQRRWTLPGLRSPRRPRQKKRKQRTDLPLITAELLSELADVAPSLSTAEREALLERARTGLRPRPSVLRDFVSALRKRAMQLRWRELQENPLPASSSSPSPSPSSSSPPSSSPSPFELVRRLMAAAATPLHLRPVQERARLLLAEGLSVIPLLPGSKEPTSSWSEWQGQAMPATLMRRSLEKLGDAAGLAVICGRVSDLLVVDLDDEGAVEWAKENLPETPWRTKTARGEHWYFRYPAGGVVVDDVLPWHGQLQGDGRYVVAPGSLHPDGHRYEAVGDWTKPRMALPLFDQRWLKSVDVLRAARARILKRDED